jgi:hypothetical protein
VTFYESIINARQSKILFRPMADIAVETGNYTGEKNENWWHCFFTLPVVLSDFRTVLGPS